MSIASSIARVQRGTAYLLTLGLAAGSGGAWLLCTAPGGATATALSRIEAQETPRADTQLLSSTGTAARNGRFRTMSVAMRDGTLALAMGGERDAGVADDPVTVEVHAQVPGRIASVRFEPGSHVEKGATLFVLDAAPFVGAVQRAESDVASARARLGAATAELGSAQRAFDEGAIGPDVLQAKVRAQREAHGGLRAAAAVLANARHELGLTRIVAPIGGRVVAVRAGVGDRVGAGSDRRALVSIVVDDPVYAGPGSDASAPVQFARLM